MEFLKIYEKWLNNPYFSEAFRDELKSIKGETQEIEDRFYKDLEFGTAGMRGIIGAGRNRMNPYIVRKATQGFANYILKHEQQENMTVVIAHDNRLFSKEFALETALVMAGNGIKAYLFEDLRTTPELSFAVRELKAAGGVVITASHNPPSYNGYKVYGPDGAQLMPEKADRVIEEVDAVEDFDKIKIISKEDGDSKNLIHYIGKDLDAIYFDKVKKLAIRKEVYKEPMQIVYTPLHGTGGYAVTEVLHGLGVHDLIPVKEQMIPDPHFTTAPKPNPEESQAFELALKYGKVNSAELLIATDPDSDRVGIMVMDQNREYVLINGNQIGALLLEYILSSRNLPQNSVVIKTVVTSDLGRAVAEHYGVKVIETLTGFKFIGDKIAEFERTGQYQYIMGYEESYGYLIEDFVRDKDAVSAVMMIVEMAKYYKQQGLSLLDVLEMLFKKHGYYVDGLQNINLAGKEGLERMKELMSDLRNNPLEKVGQYEIEAIVDIQKGEKYFLKTKESIPLDLPSSNVLKYYLQNGDWFAIRPSGTEPKIKVYFSIKGEKQEPTQKKLIELKEVVIKILK